MRRGILPAHPQPTNRAGQTGRSGFCTPRLPGAPSTDRVTRQGASPALAPASSSTVDSLARPRRTGLGTSTGCSLLTMVTRSQAAVEGLHRFSRPSRSRVSTGFPQAPRGRGFPQAFPQDPQASRPSRASWDAPPEAVGTRPSPTHGPLGGQWPPAAYSSADSRTPISEPTTSSAATTPAPRRQARAPAPGDRLQHQSRTRGAA